MPVGAIVGYDGSPGASAAIDAAGWDAEPLLKQTWGGLGLRVAQVADEVRADMVLVGSRGLGGTQAVLGSVSDMVVHYSARPVIVVPYPMLAAEYAPLPNGPVAVGWDGSAGAEMALAAALRLFPDRAVLLVTVDEGADVSPPPVDPRGDGHRDVVSLTVERGRGFHAHATSHALVAAAADHNAAVVVIGSRGRPAAREILLGSVAMEVLHQSHRPVMVVPAEWTVPPRRQNS